MSKFRRAVRGAQAGAFAAAGVALAFFVLDLVRLQPLATPGFLSGAVLAPAGLQWDLTGMSDLIAGLETAYMITPITLLTAALEGRYRVVSEVFAHGLVRSLRRSVNIAQPAGLA